MYKKGFSTVELMVAFAILTLVFGGVILADFSANYWAITSQTSNEALYKAKTRLEVLRAGAKQDFQSVVSSPSTKDNDSDCAAGGLCYFVESIVTNLSPCSKYAQAKVTWQVDSYPQSDTSLFTNLTNPTEAIELGGDCPLAPPSGAWRTMTQLSSSDFGAGNPTGIDTLGGITYMATDQAPYLEIAQASGFTAFANGFAAMDPYNDIDVARDAATGRTYGYAAIASTSVQLEVLDLTDPNNPTSVSKLALNSVDPLGSYPQGWRVFYYDRKVYITTRETTGPEFHVIDVSNPANPTELGSKELNTSAYGIVVRDIRMNGSVHRFVFLATTDDSKEIMVLDATNPAAITEVAGAATDLPGAYDSRSIFLSGTTLYIGRVQNTGPELYALDASNLLSASGGLPTLGTAEAGGDVLALRVSEPFVFAGTSRSGKELQVFATNAGVLSALGSYSASGLAGLDLEGNSIFAAGASSPKLRVIQSQ